MVTIYFWNVIKGLVFCYELCISIHPIVYRMFRTYTQRSAVDLSTQFKLPSASTVDVMTSNF